MPEYGQGWGSPTEDVTCPSGSLAKLRRPGVQGLVAAGVLQNVNVLKHLVDKHHVQRVRKGKPAKAAPALDGEKLLEDSASMSTLLEVVDKVVCYCVVAPSIKSAYRTVTDPVSKAKSREMIPYDERDPSLIYSDSVPMEDQMFVLNYAVGGTRDIEQFRNEFGENLRALEHGEGIQLSS